ncbi:MAG: response regulator, partial [Acidobacteriota bacterium]
STVRGRILLVDDNANGLTARKTVLEELGHTVTPCTNGPDALELASATSFDLIVTDYKMPRMDGIEVIRMVRKQLPATPVILISGFVDALGLTEESTGADAVVQKSSNEIPNLVRAVARLLSRKPSPKVVQSETRAAAAAVGSKKKAV